MARLRGAMMARNSTERVAWWHVRSGVVRTVFFYTLSQQQESTQLFQHWKMWCYAGFKGVCVFARCYLAPDYLSRFFNRRTCTAVTVTWTNRMVLETLHLLTSHIAVVICKQVLVQGGYYRYRKLAQSLLSNLPAGVELGEAIITFGRTSGLSKVV